MSVKIRSESQAAHLFRRLYRKVARYIPQRDEWIVFDGEIWKYDDAKRVDGMVRAMLDDLDDLDPKWRGSLNVVRNVKGFAERDKKFQIPAEKIDSDPMLVGTKTGVFDLQRHRPITAPNNSYVVSRTSVDPDFGRVPKRWLRLLREIFHADKDKIDFFQRWAGYSLTGRTSEHALLVILGTGGNGKGVLVNTIGTILGSYFREAAPSTFVDSSSRQHETAMAYLAGARFVSSGETEHGSAWNEATMKRATAGDPVTARFLYRNPFTYRPTFKIWIATNHLPKLKTVGKAMRRRLQILEFDYEPKRIDQNLELKLRTEHEAILAWMTEGTKKWLEEGLNPPRSIVETTDEYFRDQDLLGQWLSIRTRKVSGAVTATSDLLKSYNDFLHGKNVSEMENSHFGRELGDRGFEKGLAKPDNGAKRCRCTLGIRLK